MTKTAIEFHRSDCCVVQGKKYASLTTAEGSLFYNLWKDRGKWLGVGELLVNLDGERVPSENPLRLVQVHVSNIRRKLKDAGIDLVIENQATSFWAKPKYLIAKE